MVYKQDGYTLYNMDVKLKNTDKVQPIYFFAKKTPKKGTPCDLPDIYKVGKNKRTGFLYIKKK